jgi:hypothetical protein
VNSPVSSSSSRPADRLVDLVATGFYLAAALFGLWLVWYRTDLLQVDLMGHVASARLLGEGFFHRYTDAFFLGYVHNLFYPPLEDLLVSLGGRLTGDYPFAYRAYLSGLVVGLSTSLWWLGRSFTEPWSRLYLAASSCLFLLAGKWSGLDFQGLSWVDLVVVGLSSEVLGGIFYVLLLGVLLRGAKSPVAVAGLLAGSVMSHLVIGPVATVTVLAYGFLQRRLDLLVATAAALGSTAFVLLPLLVFREHLYSSTIVTRPEWTLLLLVTGLVLLAWRSSRLAPLPILAGLLLAPEALGLVLPWLVDRGLLPTYHYYRLAAPALLLTLVTGAAMVGAQARGSRFEHRVRHVAALLVLVFLVGRFGTENLLVRPLDRRSNDLTEARNTFDRLDLGRGEYGRVFVIHERRPSDFYLGSLAVASGAPGRYVQGLYWESSRTHPVLSSYLATLLGSSDIVLDHVYYETFDCEMLGCFAANFFADFNIRWLVVGETPGAEFMSLRRRRCWEMILEGNSDLVAFVPEARFEIDRRAFRLYRVEMAGSSLTNTAVEPIRSSRIRRLSGTDWSFGEVMKDAAGMCSGKDEERPVYLYDDAWPLIEGQEASDPSGSVVGQLFAVGPARWRVEVDSPTPVPFRMKLSWAPGLRLFGEDGREIPLAAGPGHLVAVGRGSMTLEHRRPPVFWLAYALSGLCVVFFGWLGWSGRWPGLRRTSPNRRPLS